MRQADPRPVGPVGPVALKAQADTQTPKDAVVVGAELTLVPVLGAPREAVGLRRLAPHARPILVTAA